ncbi:hypothetical protein M501DRAFT_932599 [Patellaria atrata CBS 101060]|uniref:Tetraspanin n=1 Tax=Patellaria atrata CBS 101060 TaxID=1346257 RepID=A0A9P4SDY0_9PEZI|nr:hypothetical protein M501DRAFT_932599 [Patellaria atrata CBS 101060]
MVEKLTLVFLSMDFIFAATGGLILAFALMSETEMRAAPSTDTVAQHLLLSQCPLTAGIVNAIFIFVTFLVSLPALFIPTNKAWLRLQGWLLVFCSLFTLILGLTIWFETLKTRSNLESMWAKEKPLAQSLLQQKFECCGYLNSTSPPFVQDSTCSNSLVAAQRQGCIGPFSDYANSFLDIVFTALFGCVGIDVLLLLCTAMLLKHRQELERYKHIDEKNGIGGL